MPAARTKFGLSQFMLALGGVASALLISQCAANAESYRWLQYGPNGLEARAATDAGQCPTAVIDGQTKPMGTRAAPGRDFPMLACALPVAETAKSLSIDGVAIGLPTLAPKRIAVLGDTGCRLKGIYIQACNDPAQWPFKVLAEALKAAKPDLIVHVGDYHYRESACPLGQAGCAGSPHGDTWAVWKADFFEPAAALLPAAPWVFVRGNHEDCERGGKGWSRFLEPQAFDAERGCNGPAPLYTIKLSHATLAIADTALADEGRANAQQADSFRSQYAGLAKLGPGPVWLLQHRPILGVAGALAGLPFGDNKTLALAARNVLPSSVSLILSGHHHLFQVLNFGDVMPAQVVMGHGGDYLNTGASTDPKGWVINGATVSSGLHDVGTFGFGLMEPQGNGWSLSNYDVTGKRRHVCSVIARQVTCQAAN